MPLEIQIGQVLDASYLLIPLGKGNNLETALNFVKNKAALMKADIDCFLLPGCSEKASKIITVRSRFKKDFGSGLKVS